MAHLPFLLNLYLLIYEGTNNPKLKGCLCDRARTIMLREAVIIAVCPGAESVGPRPAVSAASENLVEMQILRLHPRPTESDTLRVGPRSLYFNQLSR